MTLLHPGFHPGEYDVVCAKGKDAFQSPGNRHFRSLVQSQVENFDGATTKSAKGKVVSQIIDAVRRNSTGGFIKKVNGHWYTVTDRMAREKVGSEFRNLLHTKYSSSTKAKAIARCHRQGEAWTAKAKRPCSPLPPIMVSPETPHHALRATSCPNDSSYYRNSSPKEETSYLDENKHPFDTYDLDSIDLDENIDALLVVSEKNEHEFHLDDDPLPLLDATHHHSSLSATRPMTSSSSCMNTNDSRPNFLLQADLADLCDEWLQGSGFSEQASYYCSV